uniref:Uncharacterized protein n=1 Tax=Cacopsylla melanoneura TaxID=428564 RepID=A0A8D8V7N3_9HEMI
MEDEARSGRPVEVRTDANAQRVRTLIRENRRLKVRILARNSQTNFNRRFCDGKAVREDGSKKEQKQHRMTVAEDCLKQVENDPMLLDRVITGDESWFVRKPNAEAHNGCLHTPPPEKVDFDFS